MQGSKLMAASEIGCNKECQIHVINRPTFLMYIDIVDSWVITGNGIVDSPFPVYENKTPIEI